MGVARARKTEYKARMLFTLSFFMSKLNMSFCYRILLDIVRFTDTMCRYIKRLKKQMAGYIITNYICQKWTQKKLLSKYTVHIIN